MIIPDNRDEFRDYDRETPFFGPAPTALLEGLANEQDVELHVISCAKREMSAPEKLAENMWFHLLPVGQAGWLRSAYSGCVRAIHSKLKELRPDLVHGQGTERYCALAAAFSGFPSVLTIHGNMRSVAKINRAQKFSYQWCAANLEEFTIPRVNGIICISHYTRRLVVETARQTWLVPNAVGSRFFQDHSYSSQSAEILCVGSICLHKNQNTLIRALDDLATKQKFQLIFLGEGDNRDPYYLEFLELVNARAWCSHQGFVEAEQLKGFLRRAAFVALPSLEDNCPMVLLEAAASGTPMIASNVGGIPTILEDGHTGLLFDPQNPHSIQAAAERYLSDPAFAQTMARNARASAEERFEPAIVARRHTTVYEQLLNGGPS